MDFGLWTPDIALHGMGVGELPFNRVEIRVKD
jgi:hypothetical protein